VILLFLVIVRSKYHVVVASMICMDTMLSHVIKNYKAHIIDRQADHYLKRKKKILLLQNPLCRVCEEK